MEAHSSLFVVCCVPPDFCLTDKKGNICKMIQVLLEVLLELILLQEMLPPRGVPARVAEITLQRGAG